MAAKSSAVHQPKRYYRDMTVEKAQEIRKAYFSLRIRQQDLAVQFRVSQGTISRIISGKVW